MAIWEFGDYGDDELQEIWNALHVLSTYEIYENEECMAEVEAELNKRNL